MRGRGTNDLSGPHWLCPLIVFPVLAGMLTALAPAGDHDITTGSVSVLSCPAGIETFELRIEVQPLPPVLEEDDSDNVHENTVTVCIH